MQNQAEIYNIKIKRLPRSKFMRFRPSLWFKMFKFKPVNDLTSCISELEFELCNTYT